MGITSRISRPAIKARNVVQVSIHTFQSSDLHTNFFVGLYFKFRDSLKKSKFGRHPIFKTIFLAGVMG
jgi:hypothetical protein